MIHTHTRAITLEKCVEWSDDSFNKFQENKNYKNLKDSFHLDPRRYFNLFPSTVLAVTNK